MASFRWLLVLFMLALGNLPAPAAEPSYPPGSRIGLAPPAGLVPSKTFFGYEDLNNSVAIMMVALPPQAYADLDASVTADALKRQGVTMESREALPLPSGKAFLVVGRQEVDNIKVRKWILVASSPGLTGFVTVQMPEAADRDLSRRGDPRIAGHAGVSRHRSGRRAARAAALQGGRILRLSDRRRDPRPCRDVE